MLQSFLKYFYTILKFFGIGRIKLLMFCKMLNPLVARQLFALAQNLITLLL